MEEAYPPIVRGKASRWRGSGERRGQAASATRGPRWMGQTPVEQLHTDSPDPGFCPESPIRGADTRASSIFLSAGIPHHRQPVGEGCGSSASVIGALQVCGGKVESVLVVTSTSKMLLGVALPATDPHPGNIPVYKTSSCPRLVSRASATWTVCSFFHFRHP